MGEDLWWEIIDGRKHISHRVDGAYGFSQAFFDADDLRRRVSLALDHGTTEEVQGVLLGEEVPDPCYHSQSLSPKVHRGTGMNELATRFEHIFRV